MTFHGGNCGTCRVEKPLHNINREVRVFFVGDELSPVAIGDVGACCPSIRIASATFDQCRDVLRFQKEAGFRPKAGGILVVNLLSHLRRVGHAEFWREFESFADWVLNNLKIRALLSIPPFPTGYEMEDLISIIQTYRRMETAGYTGEGSDFQAFNSFQVFDAVMRKFGGEKQDIPAPPICTHTSKKTLIRCRGSLIPGCDGDWSNGMPREIELFWIRELLKSIRDTAKHCGISGLCLPADAMIEAGMRADTPPVRPHEGKRLYVVGNSNVGRAKTDIETLASTRENVQAIVMVSDLLFTDMVKNMDVAVLQSSSPTDVLVLQFLGNVMLKKKEYKSTRDITSGKITWHLKDPRIWNDADGLALVKHLNQTLQFFRQNFKGKIVCLGPFPRHLMLCCLERSHLILDPNKMPISMLDYTKVMSTYIKDGINLPDNTEFVDFRAVFGAELPFNFLCDGVHLSKDVQPQFVNYILSCLRKKPTPAVPAKHIDAPFIALLQEKKVS